MQAPGVPKARSIRQPGATRRKFGARTTTAPRTGAPGSSPSRGPGLAHRIASRSGRDGLRQPGHPGPCPGGCILAALARRQHSGGAAIQPLLRQRGCSRRPPWRMRPRRLRGKSHHVPKTRVWWGVAGAGWEGFCPSVGAGGSSGRRRSAVRRISCVGQPRKLGKIRATSIRGNRAEAALPRFFWTRDPKNGNAPLRRRAEASVELRRGIRHAERL
jgi:hypothetical protein